MEGVSIQPISQIKGAQSRIAHIEKFSLNFSNSSFVISVNLLHR